jgi:hypothetical protein
MKEAQKNKASRASQGKETARPGSPSHEEIARRAHEIFLARGGKPGREEDDWLQAERELRERRASA